MNLLNNEPNQEGDVQHISTGHLPSSTVVQEMVNEAYARFKSNNEGANASHYPALEKVPSTLFGICIVSVNGHIIYAGDVDYEFSIMSVAKPFTFAFVAHVLGIDQVRAKLGLNATGRPFNSLMGIELNPDRITNPMVNSGAIAAASLVPGVSLEEKWEILLEILSQFAGRPLRLNDEIYESASSSNFRNRAIANLMFDNRRLYYDPIETVDLYTRQSSLSVTTKDLAIMAATLADGGVNPMTREQVIDADSCRFALASMATAGMYETSGDWLVDIGLPGKSGVSGGIITAAPGKGGMSTFSPLLDKAGNSVRGQFATQFLSEQLGMNLFASKPGVYRKF